MGGNYHIHHFTLPIVWKIIIASAAKNAKHCVIQTNKILSTNICRLT